MDRIICVFLIMIFLGNCEIIYANEKYTYPISNEVKNVYDDDEVLSDNQFLGKKRYSDFAKMEEDILYFEINSVSFEKFISCPDINSVSPLFYDSTNGDIYEFYRSAVDKKLTKLLLNNKDYHIQNRFDANTVVDNVFDLDAEWFSFMKIENLQNVLSNYSINEEIIQRAFFTLKDKSIYYSKEPIILWIETAENDYFLVYEIKDNIRPSQFVFYDYFSLYNRFKIRLGKIAYNGAVLDDVVMFQDRNVYAQTRTVLELCGANVEWDDSLRAIEFNVKDEKYKYKLNQKGYKILKYFNGRFTEIPDDDYTEQDILIQGIKFDEFIYNNRIYINSIYLRDLLSIYKKSAFIDYTNAIIEIMDRQGDDSITFW